MSELTLLVLRFGFLLLLWAFIFAIVYSLRTDLFGQRVKRLPVETAGASPAPVPVAVVPAPKRPTASGPATRLVITSGSKEGVELSLGSEPLTIGRSSESGLIIRDDYTSTHHARLSRWEDGWMIQDLDSTNGTFVDEVRVSAPTPVPPGATVKIGTTSFELRE